MTFLLVDRVLGGRPVVSAVTARRQDEVTLTVTNPGGRSFFVERAFVVGARAMVSKHHGWDDVMGNEKARRALARVDPGATLSLKMVAVADELPSGWFVLVVILRRGALPAVPVTAVYSGAMLKRLPSEDTK